MENMTANYAPNGAPAMLRNPGANDPGLRVTGGGQGADNPPECVELTCNFLELEYWLTGDFHRTNDPEDGYGGRNGR